MSDPGEFFTLAADPLISVGMVTSLTEQSVLVSYAASEQEWEETLPGTNVVIASFVTAQARLKLYTQLEQLGTKALYMDTGKQKLL